MQRIVAPRREPAIHLDQVLHARHLGRQDDAVVTQAAFLGQLGRARGTRHHRLEHHLAGIQRIGAAGVFIHHFREQLLVEASPVDPDADRFAVRQCDVDDGAEVLVAPLGSDVAGIDAVLGEGRRALGILGEQQMAVVVEVPDDGHVDLGHDCRDRGRRRVVVDGDPHQLAPGLVQGTYLRHRRIDVSGVGVGHRLNDDRVGPAHFHAADVHDERLSSLVCHE